MLHFKIQGMDGKHLYILSLQTTGESESRISKRRKLFCNYTINTDLLMLKNETHSKFPFLLRRSFCPAWSVNKIQNTPEAEGVEELPSCRQPCIPSGSLACTPLTGGSGSCVQLHGQGHLVLRGLQSSSQEPQAKILMEMLQLPLLHSPYKITFMAGSFILYESSEHRVLRNPQELTHFE